MMWKIQGLAVGLVCLLCPDSSSQSLWKNARAPMRFLIADNVAHGVGDVITILIQERQQIQDDEQMDTQRRIQNDFQVQALNLLPNAFDPLPDMRYQSNRLSEGSAEFERQGRFETQISATVIDVQPNGNLVIEGKRIIQIGEDSRTIRVTGLVRPFDVAGNNTVLSEKIANAEIAYHSEGPMRRAEEPGWFTKILDAIWPF